MLYQTIVLLLLSCCIVLLYTEHDSSNNTIDTFVHIIYTQVTAFFPFEIFILFFLSILVIATPKGGYVVFNFDFRISARLNYKTNIIYVIYFRRSFENVQSLISINP